MYKCTFVHDLDEKSMTKIRFTPTTSMCTLHMHMHQYQRSLQTKSKIFIVVKGWNAVNLLPIYLTIAHPKLGP